MALVTISYPRMMLQFAEKKGLNISKLPKYLVDPILSEDSGYESISFDHLMELTQEVERSFIVPSLGAEFGLSLSESSHGFLIYALKSSRTLADALALIKKYLPMVADIVDFDVINNGEYAAMECVEVVPLGSVRRQILDFIVSVIYQSFIQRFPDGDPSMDYLVKFPYAKAAWIDNSHDQWPFRMEFDCPTMQIIFRSQLLAVESAYYDEGLNRVITEELDKRLETFQSQRGVNGAVQHILINSLPNPLSIEEVSSQMGYCSRTLRRRLRDEGVTFSQILTQVRKRQSLAMLRQSKLTVDQISNELGYEISSSFITAFKSWTGVPPGVMRKTYSNIAIKSLTKTPEKEIT